MKIKQSWGGASLPEGIIPWVARFSGNCNCGKRIRQGQPCLYDKQARKIMCKTCSKLASKGALPVALPPEAQRLMDRIKQIYVMSKPLAKDYSRELDSLLARLRTEFAQEYSARRLLVEVLKLQIDDDNVCIAMKYPDNCHGCGEKQVEGTAAIWCKSAHRIWCLDCFAIVR